MDENQEQAVPFLIYDQNTKIFTLTEQGEEVIKSINGNFGVISVAGMYRTGKSYLLNRMLLNREKGFSVGPTVNPCTKGLWIWSKPIYGTGEDGKRLPLLLIDTEGFGAFDEDHNHDIRIFTLAILLCSYFVYNSLGSIDENAIQSLSFVINLSKHIQLNKNDMNKNSNESEEMSNLFPSFLWVLRDFALQLVDENGEQITAKEYLEKVLDMTKSHQEQEQKNQIRKSIKTYFKDRDCFTMVRPMLKEKDLQNLDNSSPEKLRPEFLEQILNLRKKILTRVKVKTFKNKPLTPDMYINLIKSLIDALNSGRVPNIESTWVNMCKVECYKAFEDAQSIYDDFIKESFNNYGLADQETFRNFHSEAKDKSITLFRSRALGDVSEEYLKLLKEKIKEKFTYYFKLNNDESKSNMIRILQKWYSVIEYKIQSSELKNVEDIEMEFRNLEFKITENFGKFEFRVELFNDFKSKVLNFAGEFFLNKMNHEVSIVKQENKQIIEKLNQDISEMKSIHEKDLQKKNINLDQIKLENSEIKEQLNKIKENYAILEKEKDLLQRNLNDKLERVKDEYERKITDNILKSNILEDKVKEFERKSITVQAEAEKDKALYEQKIEQLTKQINDMNKKEKEYENEMKSQIKEQNIALKETNQKLDANLKNLQNKIEEFKEKNLILENTLTETENKLEIEKNKNEENLNKLNTEREELNNKINIIKNKLEAEKNKLNSDLKEKESDFKSSENFMKIKLEELEIKNKTAEENFKNQISKQERETAILKQNNEFLEIQAKDLNIQMEDQRKNHENIISTLESKTFSMVGHDEFQKKVEEIKTYFENEKKQNEESYEKSKNLLMLQIDSLSEKLNESEFKAKFSIDENQKEISELKIKLDKNNKELLNLRNEKLNLNDGLVKSNQETQTKIKGIIEEYEKKLEDKEMINQREMSELNKTSEESINQLKVLFESEKLRYDEKSKEEKIKHEKEKKKIIEKYEEDLKEMEGRLNEEIENLQNEKEELQENFDNFSAYNQAEYGNLKAKNDSLENTLREMKDSSANLQNSLISQVDGLTENFNKERNDLQNKIEHLTSDNNDKEKQITSLQVKKEQLEKFLKEKDENLAKYKKEFDEEKNDILNKYQQLYDEYTTNKLEYTRRNALLDQQIEYLNKKIKDAENTNEQNQKRYDGTLFGLRSEVEKDMNEKFERILKEKEDLEIKFFQKKKEFKDLEQTFMKQNTLIEKDKAVLSEKLIALEDKKKDMQEQYEKEIEILSSSLNLNRKDMSIEKQDMLNLIDNLKKSSKKFEGELLEKTSEFEKSQILSDNKYKFLEQQKENLKKENLEAQKRFETTLESIQKKNNSDKEKLENSQQNSISALELRYSTQIKELQETHQNLYKELLNSNKELEREIKNLNMKAEIKNKSYDNSSLISQINELTNEKNRLKREVESLLSEKDNKIIELINNAEKNKEIYKVKSSELDTKLKEIDTKKKSMSLEFEIEKAKWSIEKDNLTTKLQDQLENIDRMEKKYENLLRENEKLKSEKSNRRSNSKGGIHLMTGTPSNLNNSLLNNNNNNYFTARDINKNDIPRPYSSLMGNNPYNSKEVNKILDSSTNDGNSINSSRNFNEKSFDRLESKVDSRYDILGKMAGFLSTTNTNKIINFKTKDDTSNSNDSLNDYSFNKDKNNKK